MQRIILTLVFLFIAQCCWAADVVPGASDADHAFDAGSRISLTTLSPVQVANLATLAEVWGFLKYHHPSVTAGRRQWDYDLLRVMPAILAAPDQATANAALHRWIQDLGPFADCAPCATLPTENLYLHPALEWLDDQRQLSADLIADLRRVYLNRPVTGAQFYVTQAKVVQNPQFKNELDYKSIVFPDAGFQLLALFRFWSVVQYWAPYRELTGDDWRTVLRQSIPKVALAPDRTRYDLAMMAVIARLNDTHATLMDVDAFRPPAGECTLPVTMRFIQRQAVVAAHADTPAGEATGLRPGDIIEAINGTSVNALVEMWRPYYGASNEAALLRQIGLAMTNGACGETPLQVRRGGDELSLTARRGSRRILEKGPAHDRDGEAFQRLPGDIGYLKLSSVWAADIPFYLQSAQGSKGLIIDIRNYPSTFLVYALGQHLIEKPTQFARITGGDLGNPGAFYWRRPLLLEPMQPHYPGKVVLLTDEMTQSQAEFTAMAFRSAPGVKIIGSTTAGADGQASYFSLPGGLNARISGTGVFYPDGRATQRIGIVPDIVVLPTIAGIRDGRDEVLEAALAELRRE